MELFDAKVYRGKRVCVAVSGGVDSVCLLHAFQNAAAGSGITLSALHIEHGLRGEESVCDMAFCRELCAAWGIPLEVVRADVPALLGAEGGGAEEIARGVRYGAFRSFLEEGKADLIATAHHTDDVAETVLFRLARGTGLSGMRAIEEYGGIVRPLLSVTRAEIEAYAAEHHLPHVEDRTNADESYARNYIRHTVLPAFEQIHGGAKKHLAEFAALAAEEDAFLQELAESKILRIAGEKRVPVDLPAVLFARACLICIRQCAPAAYSRANIREIEKLKGLQSGRKAALPVPDGGWGTPALYAVREGNYIVFEREFTYMPPSECPFLPKTGSYASPYGFSVEELPRGSGVNREKGGLYVDLDAFPAECVVRTRKEGDEITPYHARKVSLKKFLTNRKIPARLSHRLPLIARGNEVFAVVGVEIADSVKITEKTVRPGRIEYRI